MAATPSGEITSSQRAKPSAGSMPHVAPPASSPLRRGPWAPGKARHKADQIAAIMQPLVIDGPIVGGIGCALDQEDRAAGRHLQRLGGNRVGGGCFQFIFSLDQRRVVLVLQQCEDWLGLEVVLSNLLP